MEWLKNTERIYFPNGLTLLLHPLHNSEVAALHFCVKAGYFCEQDSEVGLAHLLEHMYFKGSRSYPQPGTMGIRMKALGGIINATTSYDQTNYFCEVPAESLMSAIEIMGDAFAAPLFPAEELRKECEVVIEEFNRKLDNPAAYSQELLIQMAFTRHRMKRWRIGTPEQLRSYTADNLFDYFYRYYQPQNMVVTVAGKFHSKEVRDAIERILSSMPNREVLKDFGPEEPPQNELRHAKMVAQPTQSYLHFAFHGPGVLQEEEPVLEVLAFLLSAGRSGRLHRHVVETKRSASSAASYYMAYENVGMMMFTAVTEPDKIRNAATDAWGVMQDVCKHGISEDELQKIKNKLRLHQAMQTEDALSVAELLSYYEAYGSYEKIETHLNRMQSVTSSEISEVASKYLRLENLSVMEYVNGEVPDISPEEYKKTLQEGFVIPETNLSPPVQLPSRNGRRATTSLEPIVRRGRATYIFHPDTHYPFVAAGIFFLGGRNEETEKNAGITHLLHRGVLKGTSKYAAEQLAAQFDTLGNPPRFNCYRDFSGFTMEALPESFPSMWELLIHCIVDAQFPENEIETEKGKVLASIQRALDDNFIRPVQLFQRGFYGNHPYGLPETGFEESVQSLGRDELAGWKRRLWNNKRAIVSVVGSFDPDHMFEEMESGIARIDQGESDLQSPSLVKTPFKRAEVENRQKKQTAFVLGFPAPTASSPDAVRFDVIQQILSGMGGRLFLNLRSKKSLAYTVHAAAISALHAGAFVTYIAGEASKEKQAIEGMWQELEDLKKNPVDPEELSNARNSLIGTYALNIQTASARVLDYANSHILGRPLPYAPAYRELVRKVTAGQIMEVAQDTFHDANSTIGIVRGTAPTEPGKIITSL